MAIVARRALPALAMLAPGALFYLLVMSAATPRCPACGGSLLRRGESPGSPARPKPTQAERERRCPGCAARFE